MDISELQLKINKNKAVSDLKAVENQLGKTGEAADDLIKTLKDIGLTVGFGALVKETLQINNELKALDNRISVIFGKDFDSSAIRDIANDLNVSNIAAKSLLATIGQFASGMGQSSQFVKQFSTDLTKAAVDYGTFMGKTTSQEFSEIGRKFAKATLGEVGELKEIGIIIDTNSESFKNYVKSIQEATGASEAQARQQAITNEILAQVEHTAGSASKNIFDGWAQLNRLMDEFKGVLGEVGDIFSSALGPILKVLGDLVAIPFVKSTLAWGVAIGGVAVGYIALMKTLNKVSKLLGMQNNLRQLEPKILKKVFELQEKILRSKQRQVIIQERLNALQGNGIGVKSHTLSQETLTNLKVDVDSDLDELNKELKKFDLSVLNTIPELEGINGAFIEHLATLNLVKTGIKSTTALILGEAAAKKILALASMNLASVSSILSAVFGKLGTSLKSLGIFFSSFWKSLAGGATGVAGSAAGLAGLKAGFVALGAAMGKLLIVLAALIVVFDGIVILINLISGKEWNAGTITRWFAEWIYGLDELEKKNKEYTESIRKAFQQLQEIENLRKQLEDLKLDRIISQMLPEEAIKELESKAAKIRKEIQTNEWIVANFGTAKKQGLVEIEEGETDFEARARYQRMVNEGYKELWNTEDDIFQKRKTLIDLNKQFTKSLDQIKLQMDKIYEDFNYGYKDGKFGNYSEEQRDINRNNRIAELRRRISALSNKQDLESLKSQRELLEELFKLTHEKAKYELDSLWKQRESALSNLKLMNDLVKQATGLKQTAQSTVEADSMEAIRLQSRRYESMSKSELTPLIEQQKQVKDIERQTLAKQSQATSALEKINNQMYKVVHKIGMQSGVSEGINAVNPL
jgi:hypothetical protein